MKTPAHCAIALIFASLAFSQPTSTKPTLPIDREISDVSGKKSQGTVLEFNRAVIEFKYPQGNQKPQTALASRLSAEDLARVESTSTFPILVKIGSETVEVTKKIEASIRFRRNSDQQEFNIPLSKLSEDDHKWATSLPVHWDCPTGIRGEEKPKELEREAWAVRKEMASMSTSDIQKMIKANDYRTETWLAELEWGALNFKNHREYRYQNPVPHILAITPNTADEKMSLRKEFETAGIKSIAQTPDACVFYSGYFLYQYLVWKKGMEPITLEQFRATALAFDFNNWSPALRAQTPGLENRFARESIIKAGLKLRGIHPAYVPLSGPNNVRVDLMKYFLKKGYPIWVDVNLTVSHSILLTGFETSNGKTRFEALDSQGPGFGDGGYRWFGSQVIVQAYVLTNE